MAEANTYPSDVCGQELLTENSQIRSRFDTIKVRLQTTKDTHFKGPLDCVLQTVRKEGVGALYKGATPPLMGWMVMDSV